MKSFINDFISSTFNFVKLFGLKSYYNIINYEIYKDIQLNKIYKLLPNDYDKRNILNFFCIFFEF